MLADTQTRRSQRVRELSEPRYTTKKLYFLLNQFAAYRRGLKTASPTESKEELIAKIVDEELPLPHVGA